MCGLGLTFSAGSRSILLSTSITGASVCSLINFAIMRSSSVGGTETSTMNRTTSEPGIARVAVATIAFPSLWRGRWRPGVSTKMTCASSRVRIPMMRLRVVCGLGDTIATFCPTNWLINVDLPTFGRPITATKPER